MQKFNNPGPGPNCKESIMLTYWCNVDPLTPHFYIIKLGFTGVYIVFL